MRRAPIVLLLVAVLMVFGGASAAFAMEADDSFSTCPELVLAPSPEPGVGTVARRTSTLSAGTDNDDIVAVLLWAGEEISVKVYGPAGSDLGLRLYDPWAENLDFSPLTSVEPAHFGGPGDSAPEMTWHVADSGYYFIDTRTWIDNDLNGGSGEYELVVTIKRESTYTTIVPPKTYSYGYQPWVEGTVESVRGGTPVGPAILYFSNDGINWIPLQEMSVSGGSYSFPAWTSTVKTWYMVLYQGNERYCPSSASTYFNSKAAISSVTASRYASMRYRLTGRLRPTHKAGTYPVRIYMWRKVNGSYKSYGYVKAVVRTSSTGDYSNYEYSKLFPYKGTWRFRAYHGDSGHVGTWSSYTYKSIY